MLGFAISNRGIKRRRLQPAKPTTALNKGFAIFNLSLQKTQQTQQTAKPAKLFFTSYSPDKSPPTPPQLHQFRGMSALRPE